jgi:hypothetical protein
MGKHCDTCFCAKALVEPRFDAYGLRLSREHVLCPGCERATTPRLLAALGGICECCFQAQYHKRRLAMKAQQRLKVLGMGLALVGLLGVSGLASAATLTWSRNSESDMKEYDVYICTPVPTCTVQITATTRLGVVPQTAVGVLPSFVLPANIEGKFAVTASDLTGNESLLSAPVVFDGKPPAAPTGLVLTP